MVLLAIDWASVGVKALQFILSFSILVTLHEFGHFITARIFKCRVEKFYLFFDPWFSLFKKKVGDTEYGIGWVPFGGYVKIAGMVDESMDKEQLKQEPKPWEFRSKPAWQRLIIMCAGVVMNLLLGFFIYSMMLFHWGDEYLPTQNLTYGVTADSLAQSVGFKNGDKILSVDHKPVERFKNVAMNVILDGATSVQVDRNGQKIDVAIPKTFAGDIIKYKDIAFLSPRYLMYPLGTVVDTMPAKIAGFKVGDKIIGVNGNAVQFFDQFKESVSNNKGKLVTAKVLRGNDTLNLSVNVPADGIIGIAPNIPDNALKTHLTKYGFWESFPGGFQKGKETLRSYVLQLKLIFSGKVKANESLGGVISMGNLFPSLWDWQTFWGLTAFFSMVLALMNILPIPALDGGHVLFCLIEMITGRKPSDKTLEVAQMIGMVLLLGLMVYALGLDFWRLFKK
ncbi:RIP metalloprotease RseP [Rhizosphaericola mali]|uniref:Zinc metalloprotease n=1 Tax=Rhizosphaericola mali TaxID=2545455 RepID=A0A5P2GA42_9BACT|nr:RIP metalloprotease RseP [Rhizosphaericola mali]QES90570.1 RIP metalloprotease RseP [Rhizosphaericola mali]